VATVGPPLVVALIGFMGAGKTTVGRILASRLGAEFVDLDGLIVSSAGTSIADIFRTRGEQAFREIESACLREVSAAAGLTVLATGGGAPVRPENRLFFRERALTFYLTAPFDVLASRTAGDAGRPLRGGSLEEVRRLYESRLPVYEELGRRVDTQGRMPEEVAGVIADLVGDAREPSPALGV
jgi:shikimate kinase